MYFVFTSLSFWNQNQFKQYGNKMKILGECFFCFCESLWQTWPILILLQQQVAKESSARESQTSSKGSPTSHKQRARNQTTKHVTKPSQVKHPVDKGNTNIGKTGPTVGTASKKSDRKVVSSKAKQGFWK